MADNHRTAGIQAKMSKAHKDQAKINQGILEQINFRNHIERSLIGLLETVDTITLDAHNANKKMSNIKEHLDKFYTGLFTPTVISLRVRLLSLTNK